MNGNGWILLSRKLLDWQWFDKAEMVKLWLYILLSANIEDKKWQGIEIKRGQLVTSVQHLTEALHLTTQQVRTALKRLQDGGEITTKTTNHFTLITICNFTIYQDYDPTQQQTNNKPITNKQQTNNKPITTTKQLTINNNNTLSLTRAREENEKTFSQNGQPETSDLETETTEKEKSSAQKEKEFEPPTVQQVSDFCIMNGLTDVNPELFVAHYESTGWESNGRPLKNWRAAAIKWNIKGKQDKNSNSNGNYNNRQKGTTRHASLEPTNNIRPDEF